MQDVSLQDVFLHLWLELLLQQVLDEVLGRHVPALQVVYHVVQLVGPEGDLSARLFFGLLSHAVRDDSLQPRVDCPLVCSDHFLEQYVFSPANDLFGLPASALLGLPPSALPLSDLDHSRDPPLLLEPDQFLGQLVHSFRDDGSLQGFGQVCQHSVLLLLDQLLGLRVLLQRLLLTGPQLLDQVLPLDFAREHLVLVGPSLDNSLKKHACTGCFFIGVIIPPLDFQLPLIFLALE